MTVGAAGNLLILYVFSVRWQSKSTFTVYSTYQAGMQALKCIVLGPIFCRTTQLMIRGDLVGEGLCKMYRASTLFFIVAPSLLLLLSAAGRYHHVMYPWRIHYKTKALILCLVTAGVTALLSIPAFILYGPSNTSDPSDSNTRPHSNPRSVLFDITNNCILLFQHRQSMLAKVFINTVITIYISTMLMTTIICILILSKLKQKPHSRKSEPSQLTGLYSSSHGVRPSSSALSSKQTVSSNPFLHASHTEKLQMTQHPDSHWYQLETLTDDSLGDDEYNVGDGTPNTLKRYDVDRTPSTLKRYDVDGTPNTLKRCDVEGTPSTLKKSDVTSYSVKGSSSISTPNSVSSLTFVLSFLGSNASRSEIASTDKHLSCKANLHKDASLLSVYKVSSEVSLSCSLGSKETKKMIDSSTIIDFANQSSLLLALDEDNSSVKSDSKLSNEQQSVFTVSKMLLGCDNAHTDTTSPGVKSIKDTKQVDITLSEVRNRLLGFKEYSSPTLNQISDRNKLDETPNKILDSYSCSSSRKEDMDFNISSANNPPDIVPSPHPDTKQADSLRKKTNQQKASAPITSHSSSDPESSPRFFKMRSLLHELFSCHSSDTDRSEFPHQPCKRNKKALDTIPQTTPLPQIYIEHGGSKKVSDWNDTSVSELKAATDSSHTLKGQTNSPDTLSSEKRDTKHEQSKKRQGKLKNQEDPPTETSIETGLNEVTNILCSGIFRTKDISEHVSTSSSPKELLTLNHAHALHRQETGTNKRSSIFHRLKPPTDKHDNISIKLPATEHFHGERSSNSSTTRSVAAMATKSHMWRYSVNYHQESRGIMSFTRTALMFIMEILSFLISYTTVISLFTIEVFCPHLLGSSLQNLLLYEALHVLYFTNDAVFPLVLIFFNLSFRRELFDMAADFRQWLSNLGKSPQTSGDT